MGARHLHSARLPAGLLVAHPRGLGALGEVAARHAPMLR